MGHIVDTVQIGLIILIIQVLPLSPEDLEWLHLGVVETERRTEGGGRERHIFLSLSIDTCLLASLPVLACFDQTLHIRTA